MGRVHSAPMNNERTTMDGTHGREPTTISGMTTSSSWRYVNDDYDQRWHDLLKEMTRTSALLKHAMSEAERNRIHMSYHVLQLVHELLLRRIDYAKDVWSGCSGENLPERLTYPSAFLVSWLRYILQPVNHDHDDWMASREAMCNNMCRHRFDTSSQARLPSITYQLGEPYVAGPSGPPPTSHTVRGDDIYELRYMYYSLKLIVVPEFERFKCASSTAISLLVALWRTRIQGVVGFEQGIVNRKMKVARDMLFTELEKLYSQPFQFTEKRYTITGFKDSAVQSPNPIRRHVSASRDATVSSLPKQGWRRAQRRRPTSMSEETLSRVTVHNPTHATKSAEHVRGLYDDDSNSQQESYDARIEHISAAQDERQLYSEPIYVTVGGDSTEETII